MRVSISALTGMLAVLAIKVIVMQDAGGPPVMPLVHHFAMPLPSAPTTPGLQARSLGRGDEAFFPDEWGTLVRPSKLHENKFATVGKNHIFQRPNPLLDPLIANTPELDARELAEVRRSSTTAHLTQYHMYAPSSFGGNRAVVTLLYGTGSEIQRHGLRLMLDGWQTRVLVSISGREDGLGSVKHPWGGGITASIIKDLFAGIGFPDMNFTIDIIACFSTGYRGMIGSINNFAWEPSSLDLRGVKRIVILDALYKGDEPAPGDNYKRALVAMDSVTNGKALLIVYDVTAGGTPWQNGDTRVSQSLLQSTYKDRYLHLRLQTPSATANLFALCYARMFHAAVEDGYFLLADLPQALRNLIASGLPERNTVNSMVWRIAFQVQRSGKITLDQWAGLHPDDVQKVQADLDPLRTSIINNPGFFFLCWRPKNVGDILHDTFIREFAWEFLR
jgi:hypothetical protein